MIRIKIIVGALFCLLVAAGSYAGTPVTLYQSFAGNLNYTGAAGSLRRLPNDTFNNTNECQLNPSSSATLVDTIPATATITAAFLYWAGSGATPDLTVTFQGNTITATRSFTEFFGFGYNLNYFSGFADVTSIVQATRNGTYTFSGLTVDNGGSYCTYAAVLSGWAMIVVYEESSEPLRVINIFDGFEYYWGSSITLTPSNFRTPMVGIDGKQSHISWEGDETNSGSSGGITEDLRFNGNQLTDGVNPSNNQFNSTVSNLDFGGPGTNTTYGVDFDTYDVSSYIGPNQTSATSVYSSGADLVLLSCEVISVANVETADLAISKTHSGNFVTGGPYDFTIDVTNNGPSAENGIVTVTDTLPAGLTYDSFAGAGWSVDTSSAPTILFSYDCTSAPLASGSSLPTLTVTVDVGAAAYPGVSNTASVDSDTTFDNISGNDSDTDSVTVIQGADLAINKIVDNASPELGDTITYTVTVTNNGTYNATNVVVNDLLPSGVTYVSNTPSQGGYNSGTGVWTVGTVNVSASATLTISATVDQGTGGTTITNTATSGGSDYVDPVSSNNNDSADITPIVPDLLIMKIVQTISDPVGSANPKAIPGAVMLYTIQVTNQGAGTVNTDTMVITDAVPSNTKLYVGDLGDGPIVFLDGSSYGGTNSGLDPYNFISLGDGTDDLSFSDDNGTSYTYTPTADGDDCDENVTNIRVNPKGVMDGASGGNTPSFQIRFRVQVE